MNGKMEILLGMVSLLAMLLAGGVRGDECRDMRQDCQWNVTSSTVGITDLFSNEPPNATAIVEKCQAVHEMMATCEGKIRAVCSPSSSVNDTIESMQTSYNSVCGQETVCNFQVLECNMKKSDVSEITEAMRQEPPDVQAMSDKCREVNVTLTPCVEKLKADCGDVSSFAGTIASISSTFDSLCGTEPMCQMQMAKCHSFLGQVQAAQGNYAELCRILKASRHCFYVEVDARCHALPEVQAIIRSFNTSTSSIVCSEDGTEDGTKCPQVWECLNQNAGGDNEDCSWPGSLMTCVDGLKSTCQVKEDRITFKELETLSTQFCKEIKKADTDEGNCSALGECVMQSEAMKKIYGAGTPSTPQLKISAMLDSQTWCEYMEVASGCYVSTAGGCEHDPSLVSYMTQQHKHLKDVCHSSAHGGKGALGDSILVLLVAVLTAWAHSHL